MQIVSECIASASRDDDSIQSRYIREAQDYLTANYRIHIALDLFAEAVSLNKFYFQKLFCRKQP